MRKKSITLKYIGFILLSIFICGFISLEVTSIIMLLAKLCVVLYSSLCLVLGLSEFRLGAFKGINKKIEMLESRVRELEMGKDYNKENAYVDKSVRDNDLANNRDLGKNNSFAFSGKPIKRSGDEVGKNRIRSLSNKGDKC